MRSAIPNRAFLLAILVLGSSTVAHAESDYGIAMPSYIAAAAQKFTTELTRRQVAVPLPPKCAGFPGLNPTDREYMVLCTMTALCWDFSIGSVGRRLSLYTLAGRLSDDCTAAGLEPIQAATVVAFVSCADKAGRDASMSRLLREPMDVSDPAKAAEVDRQLKADPDSFKRFRIDDLCKTMIGHRAISIFNGSPRDELWLSYLKPEFAPP